MTSPIDAPLEPGLYLPTADRRVVMYGRTWADYEAQLALQGERSRPKLAYLDGDIELMSPSRDHETINSRIGRVIDADLVHRRMHAIPNGEWTLKAQASEAGAQPDECYLFGEESDSKPRPDLVLEVARGNRQARDLSAPGDPGGSGRRERSSSTRCTPARMSGASGASSCLTSI